jgi:transketolase
MTYEELLASTAASDERIVVLTAENRAAIRNLPARLGNRFIDVGIAEQTMVGAAAGLALRGRIPLVHALATFLTLRAFEFIRTDVGIGNLPVKLIGGVPGFLSDANGPTHQAVEDIALMRGIPNVKVFCPADLQELVAGMPAILTDPSPWYVRYNSSPPAVTHTGGFRIGEAEILSRGSDVTLLAFGFLLREAERARQILQERSLSVGLVNLRTLKPIDEAAILSAARETRLLVTLEDHFQTGGLASIVTEVLYRGGQHPPLLSIALPNRWFKPALLDDVLHHEGFTGQQLAERILAALPPTP